LKVTYTEEAVADIVEAITYLNERSSTAAAKLDADIARCVERLADRGDIRSRPDRARVLTNR
jgi:plasmid stabilization system protein ParE